MLGRGSAGVVYRMRDRTDGRIVAVKVAGTAAGRRELVREVEVARALRHANVLEAAPVPGPGGALAVASPYATGGTLRAVLAGALAAAQSRDGADARAPLGYVRTAAVLRDVAAALAHVHAAGVVHADVKPENVFLDAGSGRALLGDFGIARPAVERPGGDGRNAPAAPTDAGTPAYMAPEQAAGAPLDSRADVYALGLVGWEMLTGCRPWEGRAAEAVLHAQRFEALPPLAELCPEVPAYLLVAIEGALAKDPGARWADGAEMLRRLTPTPAPRPVAARPDSALAGAATMRFATGEGRHAARSNGRGPGRVAATVGAAALALAAVALPFRRPGAHATGRAAHQSAVPVRAVDVAREHPTPDVPAPPVVRPATPVARPATAQGAACGDASDAAQRRCADSIARPAERRAHAAADALAAAIRAAAGTDWEPVALTRLRAEQTRWERDAARACGARVAGGGGDGLWGASRGACRAERATARAAELAARRARFSPSADAPPGGG